MRPAWGGDRGRGLAYDFSRFVSWRDRPPIRGGGWCHDCSFCPDYWAWLNGATAADQVQALVRPCPEAALAVYAVGKAVGNVRTEGAGLIQPSSTRT